MQLFLPWECGRIVLNTDTKVFYDKAHVSWRNTSYFYKFWKKLMQVTGERLESPFF